MNNKTAPTDRGTSELPIYKFGPRRVGAKGYEGIDKVQLTSSLFTVFVWNIVQQAATETDYNDISNCRRSNVTARKMPSLTWTQSSSTAKLLKI